MVSALTIDDIGIVVTRSSAITEQASSDNAVAPAFLRGYLSGPEPVEAPIDFALAVSQPRLHDHPDEPETPSAWGAIRSSQH
jgi:hypothetical protein